MARTEPFKEREELDPDEDLTECPFDPSHKIKTDQMLSHVLICEPFYTKHCRKAGLSNSMAHCVHNYAHVCPRKEIEDHELQCPDQYRPPPLPVKNAKATTTREPEVKASLAPPVKEQKKTRRRGRKHKEVDAVEKSSPSPKPYRTIPGMQTEGGKKEQVKLPTRFPDLNEMRKRFNEKFEKMVMEKRELLKSKANLDRTPPSSQELASNRPISPDDLPKFGQLEWVQYWLKYLALPEQVVSPDEETEVPRESIPDMISPMWALNEMAPPSFQHGLEDLKLDESGESDTETVISGTSASTREPNMMDPSRIRRRASRRVRSQRLKNGGPSGDEADEEESD